MCVFVWNGQTDGQNGHGIYRACITLRSKKTMHKRGLCRHAVTFWCLSVRLSVCLSRFVHSVETNKHIFKIFPSLGSHTILVFHTKRHGNIPTGIPLTGRRMQVGEAQITILDE